MFDDEWAEQTAAEWRASTLIFTCTHLATEAQRRLFVVQQALLSRLNPGIPRLIIDSGSPITPDSEGRLLLSLPDALGHPGHTPGCKDGPGRAIMAGLSLAIALGYKRAVYTEADALVSTPVEWGFQRMNGKPVGMQPRCQHNFLDTQMIWFGDLAWLKAVDFVGRYDWPNNKRTHDADALYEELLGADNIEILPHLGGRVDPPVAAVPWPTDGLTADNLHERFPGCHYLTHGDGPLNAEFLRMNGHGDLVESL